MYCTNCGNEVKRASDICMNCGFKSDESNNYCYSCGLTLSLRDGACISCGAPIQNINFNQSGIYREQIVDEPEALANVAVCAASCLFPIIGSIVGFLVYLIWKDTRPKAANSVCIWTIVGLVVPFLFYIIIVILSMLGYMFTEPSELSVFTK